MIPIQIELNRGLSGFNFYHPSIFLNKKSELCLLWLCASTETALSVSSFLRHSTGMRIVPMRNKYYSFMKFYLLLPNSTVLM
jgi:hypothetical protein